MKDLAEVDLVERLLDYAMHLQGCLFAQPRAGPIRIEATAVTLTIEVLREAAERIRAIDAAIEQGKAL